MRDRFLRCAKPERALASFPKVARCPPVIAGLLERFRQDDRDIACAHAVACFQSGADALVKTAPRRRRQAFVDRLPIERMPEAIARGRRLIGPCDCTRTLDEQL